MKSINIQFVWSVGVGYGSAYSEQNDFYDKMPMSEQDKIFEACKKLLEDGYINIYNTKTKEIFQFLLHWKFRELPKIEIKQLSKAI